MTGKTLIKAWQGYITGRHFSFALYLCFQVLREFEVLRMQRGNHGRPITMMHRWNPLSLLCEACGEKKRGCDQVQPCFNCVQRNTLRGYSV
ncbi:unnamed protein product [Penicillium camemberti]|uniref:Str. FM013 n=1 Tax=Penicillium camemberti (strain FM 013) TaxID=1429867 RepID=A0A0G4NV54_PENC3|nr:unnamed protein product [Penicillium camemberti]